MIQNYLQDEGTSAQQAAFHRALIESGLVQKIPLNLKLAQSTPSLEQQALTLQKSGLTGLKTFLKQHQQILQESTTTLPPEPFRRVLDSLCHQRDCHAS
jgi:hypothetical protein